MIENKLNYLETRRLFEISSYNVLERWERIYLSEGLYIERRRRASASNGTKKGRPRKFPKDVEEDLLYKVQHLRAEVAYLKN